MFGFDSIGMGGPLDNWNPLGSSNNVSVIGGMSAVAGALGTPGFGYAMPAFPLIASVFGGVGSASYFGTPGFRGVANIAEGSNNIQRGFPWNFGLSWGGMGGMWGGDCYSCGGSMPIFGMAMAAGASLMGLGNQPVQQAAAPMPAGPAQALAPQPPPPTTAAPAAAPATPTPAATPAATPHARRGGRRGPAQQRLAPPPTPQTPSLWNRIRNWIGI